MAAERDGNQGGGETPHRSGRAEYVVAPDEVGWVVRLKGDSQTELFTSKEQAVQRARQLVSRYPSGTVTVLSGSGAVESAYVHDERGSG